MASDSTIFTLPSADVKAGILPRGKVDRNSGVWLVLPSLNGARVRVRLLRLAAARIWVSLLVLTYRGFGERRGTLKTRVLLGYV